MVAVTVLICITVAILFSSMVLSAMASSEAKRGNTSNAQKYSMWSAIVCGLAVFFLIIAMFLYLNSGVIASAAQSALGGAQKYVGGYIPAQ